MSTAKTKRNRKRQIERMSIPELEKMVRVMRPEIARMAQLLAYAEHEINRRNRHEPVAHVASSDH